MKLRVRQVSLTLGAVFALLHFAFVLLVTFSGGSLLANELRLHHLTTPFSALPLNLPDLVLGTLIASLVGTLIGALFTAIWNALDQST